MKAKKIVIPAVCVALVAAAGLGIAAATSAAAPSAFTNVSPVKKQESLMSYVTVSGTVESQSCNKVCSTLAYPVEKINYEVGDRVHKGDVLCTLNTDSLQNQILQQQAVVDSSNVTSQYQLTEAEKNYNNALEEYNSGNNMSIASAEQSLEQAKIALDKAQSDYDNAVAMSGKDKNTQLRSAELALENAKSDLKTANSNYEKVKKEAAEEDYYSIKDLKKAYDDAKDALEDSRGLHKNVIDASKSYQEAYETYTYYYNNQHKIPIDRSLGDYLAALKAAEDNWAAMTEKYKLENTRKVYDEAMQAYEKAKADIDKRHSDAVESAENAVKAAEKSVSSAEIQIQSINDNTNDGINSYKNLLSSAQMTYENAKENLALARKTAEANLSSLKSAAERERTLSGLNDSQLIALESLKEQLEEAVITAPADGVITYIGASEGGETARGTLFTIEDADSLKITANLREYDVADVEIGMKVIITTGAYDGEEYEGIITKIAPTAQKNADGSDAGTALFAVEAAVTSKNTKLRIGMTAKMRIVTKEKSGVLTVPYGCVTADKDGRDVIYIAEKTDSGYTAKCVPVTVGMETDFYAEISGSGIKENILVIDDPSLIIDGQMVLVNEAELGGAESESKQ